MTLNIKAWQEALSRDNELPSIGFNQPRAERAEAQREDKPLSQIENLYRSLGIDFDPARILGRLR